MPTDHPTTADDRPGWIRVDEEIEPDAPQADRRHRELRLNTKRAEVLGAASVVLGERGDVYQRGGVLLMITREQEGRARLLVVPPGTPRSVPIPDEVIALRLAESADIISFHAKSEDWVPAHPPAWLPKTISRLGQWDPTQYRPLFGITEVPTLRLDGTVLQRPGYDEDSGLYLMPRGRVVQVSPHPAAADVKAAKALLEEAVCDVPFARQEHRSAWFGSVFTTAGRFSYQGPAPCSLADGTAAGSGKGLIAQVAATIATGRRAAVAPPPKDRDEQRKLITTIALEGARVTLLDNIDGVFGGGPLCAAMTTVYWQDRILGKSQSYSGPLLTTWIATGNNVELGEDMHRRINHIRLEPVDELPEERKGFKHPELLSWVDAHQPELLAAVLTIMRGYWDAGRPDQHLTPWGSYEGWSAAVRAPIVWAGWTDPGAARQGLRESSSSVDETKRAVVDGWRNAFGDGERTAGHAEKELWPSEGTTRYPELAAALESLARGKKPSSVKLGMILSGLRGRTLGGAAIVDRSESGRRYWRVEERSATKERDA